MVGVARGNGHRAAERILDAGLNQVLIAVVEHRQAHAGGIDVNQLAGSGGTLRRYQRAGDGGAAQLGADGGHDHGSPSTGAGTIGQTVAIGSLNARGQDDALKLAGGSGGDFRIQVDQVDERVADAGYGVAGLHGIGVGAAFDADGCRVAGGGGSVHRDDPGGIGGSVIDEADRRRGARLGKDSGVGPDDGYGHGSSHHHGAVIDRK